MHLTRGQVHEPVLMQHREHLRAFGRRESPRLKPRFTLRPGRHRARPVPTVMGRAGTSHRSAGRLDAHHRSQFGDRLIERGLDHRSLSLWLLSVARVIVGSGSRLRRVLLDGVEVSGDVVVAAGLTGRHAVTLHVG